MEVLNYKKLKKEFIAKQRKINKSITAKNTADAFNLARIRKIEKNKLKKNQ